MKPWCLLLICLSCSLMRVGADYYRRYRDKSVPYLHLAGVLVLLLLSLGKRRSLPVATSTTRTKLTTITTANPQPRCNNGYTMYSGPGRSFCFRYVTILRSWDDARRYCQMENADLPILDNQSLVPFSDVLIQMVERVGSTYLRATTDPNLIARYTDGTTIPSDSPLWVGGEPNNPNDCIILVFVPAEGASLSDRPCGASENFVCQHV